MSIAKLPVALRRGRRAESAALDYLKCGDMVVLSRNVRVGYLEIDVIARDQDMMVIIEVRSRTRGAWVGALASIGPRKQHRLRRAASILWARRWHRDMTLRGVRFDVIAVDLRQSPVGIEHLRAAF